MCECFDRTWSNDFYGDLSTWFCWMTVIERENVDAHLYHCIPRKSGGGAGISSLMGTSRQHVSWSARPLIGAYCGWFGMSRDPRSYTDPQSERKKEESWMPSGSAPTPWMGHRSQDQSIKGTFLWRLREIIVSPFIDESRCKGFILIFYFCYIHGKKRLGYFYNE